MKKSINKTKAIAIIIALLTAAMVITSLPARFCY
jgi:hypothetical protein